MLRSLLYALLLAATVPATAQHTVRGRVLDAETPVGYATAVLLRDGRQAAGTTTDPAGRFAFPVDTGHYVLVLRHVSYQLFETAVQVGTDDTDLGDLRLAPLGIREVTVTAETVTRQADRFVVTVGDTPALAGQDGTELLARAPGVWLGDDGISINGAAGAKVYVDGRELKGAAEETTSYLRSLTAADIARIEVVPLAGAEFAADTRGGAILITLRRRRDDGMDGNVQFSTTQGSLLAAYAPSGRIAVRRVAGRSPHRDREPSPRPPKADSPRPANRQGYGCPSLAAAMRKAAQTTVAGACPRSSTRHPPTPWVSTSSTRDAARTCPPSRARRSAKPQATAATDSTSAAICSRRRQTISERSTRWVRSSK